MNKIESLNFKDKVKTDVYPVLAGLLNSVGVSWATLGDSAIGRNALIAQSKKISKTLLNNRNDGKQLRICFLTMIGSHTHNVAIDIALAFGLKAKGHKVFFILDDQCLPITEDKKAGQEDRWNELSARSFNFGYKFIKSAGFEILPVSEIVNTSINYDISPFKSIVEAGILKHYKVGVIDENRPDVKAKKALLEKSTMISAQVGEYLVKEKVDRVIMSHGIYPTWGPAFNILTSKSIPVLTYSKTKKAKTEKFNWNSTGDWWDVSEEWERVKEIPLNATQEIKINEYLESRIDHSKDVLVYNFGKLEDETTSYTRFNLDPNKLTFSLFTNVLWDAASAQREIAFSNPVEWVFETIDWFRKHPDKQLIVKIHPAEVVIGTNQPFADLIRERVGELPANVRLIEPHEKVNSWSIYKITDLGIVHTTTSGMELPLLGKPCIVVSRTHFREKGFTVDLNSKEEYFNYLRDFKKGQVESENLIKYSKRYSYLLFERYQVPFDIFHEKNWTDVRYFKFNSIKELFSIEYFEELIDRIIRKEPILVKEN